MSAPDSAPFTRIKIRVAGVVFCGDDVALIRRERSGSSTHFTLPGGNVEAGEDLDAALARELDEELTLNLDRATSPELLWLVDQRVSRPGPTPPPRKLHLIYRLHVTPEVRRSLADTELDEQPDGSHEVGLVEWVNYRSVGARRVFPPAIGPALSALPAPSAASGPAALAPVTDANYVWL